MAKDEVVENTIAIHDSYEIFVVPKELDVTPGDLLYNPKKRSRPMRKTTKSEEYMYYLGHATAIASLDVLLSDLPPSSQREMIGEWMGIMKKNYAATSLWQEAQNNLHGKQKQGV